MPFHNAPRCTHVRITGDLCKSPALRGKTFCYFHERLPRGEASLRGSRFAPRFILDTPESIQYATTEIMNRIVLGTLEHKTASLLLRALNLADRNCHGRSSKRAPGGRSQPDNCHIP